MHGALGPPPYWRMKPTVGRSNDVAGPLFSHGESVKEVVDGPNQEGKNHGRRNPGPPEAHGGRGKAGGELPAPADRRDRRYASERDTAADRGERKVASGGTPTAWQNTAKLNPERRRGDAKKGRVELPDEDIRVLLERQTAQLQRIEDYLVKVLDEIASMPAEEMRLQMKAERKAGFEENLSWLRARRPVEN